MDTNKQTIIIGGGNYTSVIIKALNTLPNKLNIILIDDTSNELINKVTGSFGNIEKLIDCKEKQTIDKLMKTQNSKYHK